MSYYQIDLIQKIISEILLRSTSYTWLTCNYMSTIRQCYIRIEAHMSVDTKEIQFSTSDLKMNSISSEITSFHLYWYYFHYSAIFRHSFMTWTSSSSRSSFWREKLTQQSKVYCPSCPGGNVLTRTTLLSPSLHHIVHSIRSTKHGDNVIGQISTIRSLIHHLNVVELQ